MLELEDKMTTAIVEVGKDVASDIVRPTSKSIGDNLGLLVDGVMGWLGYWGQKQAIKREVYLDDYKKKISEKIASIPEEKLKEPEIRVVGPAIEASKFYIEESTFRDMFAEMISSACHTDMAGKVHPAFPEMIKQLSLVDVKLLELFKQSTTFPCVEIYAQHKDTTITPFPYILFDFKTCTHSFNQQDELSLTESVDNLVRLGLLLKNSNVIELRYNYEGFINHWFYKLASKTIPEDSTMKMRKYRIELTELGENFKKCCFDE